MTGACFISIYNKDYPGRPSLKVEYLLITFSQGDSCRQISVHFQNCKYLLNMLQKFRSLTVHVLNNSYSIKLRTSFLSKLLLSFAVAITIGFTVTLYA